MNVSGKTTVKKMLKSVHLNRTDALFQTQKINESKSTSFNKTNMVIILSKPQHLILVYVFRTLRPIFVPVGSSLSAKY